MNFKLAIQLLKNMGIRYSAYRIMHEYEKRMGILEKKHPVNPETKFFISLDKWKQRTDSFVFKNREALHFSKAPNDSLRESAERILKGEICFFSSDWKKLGLDYDWISNPETNYKYDIFKHWSEIKDFNPANGDIKYVWEKSRFTYLLTIMRYDYHFDEDHSTFVFDFFIN